MRGSPREISLWRFGDGSWSYTLIPEPDISTELARQSDARAHGTTHCVSFQPNGLEENWNQDVQLRAIFDGHMGYDTVNHVAEHLSTKVQDRLNNAFPKLDPDSVSSLLAEVITTVDDSLLVDLLSGIPSESQLSSLTEYEVQNILGGDHRSKVLRSMQGTTVIIALTNPDNEDLWVASLGDSYAVLGIQSSYDDRRESMFLSSYHNGLNPRERERLIRGHPNEPEVLSRNRVLGGLAVTRVQHACNHVSGDYPYKLPSIYTDRVFLHASQSRNQRELINSVNNRNLTPPYISNVPDVKYVDLKSKRLGDSPSRLNTDKKGNDIVLRMCLLMCTDGLVDLYEDELETKEPLDIFQRCMDVACAVPTARYCKTSTTDHCDNVALSILRDALGGTDIEKVSTMMTVEMQDKWMDDTTILFEFL
ncbi:phosphatase 2C-like domain-containing protein [Lentinula edodes]|uniref:phosphatase 2C-like domain-containing protein n=1 Tax=Lentinula edodes TaxID=5353 RepID=UPI001E8DE2F8|nr:phosphatase 2C-like domain-containing protein [Lentinula edodes]KAH7868470.1 phosphatase 2C-like domain-containing protein [Lentinula edodes]